MHDVPAWVESLRGVLLVVVWSVLIIRVPAAWRPRQRPAWIVLVVLASGSVVLQAGVAAWINDVTGVTKASELLVTLVATADFAAVWWFALELHRAADPGAKRWYRAPAVAACAMATIAVTLFVLTPAPDRFAARAQGWWVWYAIAWIGYGATTAIGAAAIFWRYGVTMRNPVVRLSVLALAAGTSAELPYLAIRAYRWFVPDAPAGLALVGFWCSFTRFVVVAIGCSLAALEPLRKAALYRERRHRLYGLWAELRQATPELALREVQPRYRDLVAVGDGWELLHRRVVEIRDSVAALRDGWATENLISEAERHALAAAPPGDARLVAIACWVEVTRRAAIAGAPRLHARLDGDPLPPIPDRESTDPAEVRWLLLLRRHLRSNAVRDFAHRQEDPLTSGPVL